MPGIHNARQVAGWRLVTGAVHAAGGKIFLQLWHAGRMSHPCLQPEGALPVAPSAVCPQGSFATAAGPVPFVTPRELAVAEISAIVAQFADAARKAREAGFDGVEVHAANGYLIDQFLRDCSNQRTDDYGGPPVKRARFLLEVVDAVAAAWDGRRVSVRLSPVNAYNGMKDSHPQASFETYARLLAGRELACLHVDETSHEPFDWPAFRRCFAGTYVANGGYDLTRTVAAVESACADLVSFGVAWLANPDLVERLRTGMALNVADRATFYGGGERGYTDYPTMGQAERTAG